MLSLNIVDAPQTVVAASMFDVTFVVRNKTERQLFLCSPGGVTMQLRSSSYVWPMVIHGMTTDTDCSGAFSLEPHGEKTFVEHGVLRNDLPTSTARIIGTIALYCRDTAAQRNCRDASLHTEQPVQVSRIGV
jgi:hypothetical protein